MECRHFGKGEVRETHRVGAVLLCIRAGSRRCAKDSSGPTTTKAAATGRASSGTTTTASTEPSKSTQSTTTTTESLQSVAWASVTVPPAVSPGLSQPVKRTATTGPSGTYGSATLPAPAGHQFGTPDDVIDSGNVFYGSLEPGETSPPSPCGVRTLGAPPTAKSRTRWSSTRGIQDS